MGRAFHLLCGQTDHLHLHQRRERGSFVGLCTRARCYRRTQSRLVLHCNALSRCALHGVAFIKFHLCASHERKGKALLIAPSDNLWDGVEE
ncbi:hypothetical protein V5799_002181 [Amblyomma americanum]|uniref:Uncharacterized protein n=1 Tax=Amblyomma americanum TaxID=6943 RepID=A0AAQ4CY28_AMBAM